MHGVSYGVECCTAPLFLGAGVSSSRVTNVERHTGHRSCTRSTRTKKGAEKSPLHSLSRGLSSVYTYSARGRAASAQSVLSTCLMALSDATPDDPLAKVRKRIIVDEVDHLHGLIPEQSNLFFCTFGAGHLVSTPHWAVPLQVFSFFTALRHEQLIEDLCSQLRSRCGLLLCQHRGESLQDEVDVLHDCSCLATTSSDSRHLAIWRFATVKNLHRDDAIMNN